jgi:hypothetical protein
LHNVRKDADGSHTYVDIRVISPDGDTFGEPLRLETQNVFEQTRDQELCVIQMCMYMYLQLGRHAKFVSMDDDCFDNVKILQLGLHGNDNRPQIFVRSVKTPDSLIVAIGKPDVETGMVNVVPCEWVSHFRKVHLVVAQVDWSG